MLTIVLSWGWNIYGIVCIARTDFLITHLLSVYYAESLFVLALSCVIKGPISQLQGASGSKKAGEGQGEIALPPCKEDILEISKNQRCQPSLTAVGGQQWRWLNASQHGSSTGWEAC